MTLDPSETTPAAVAPAVEAEPHEWLARAREGHADAVRQALTHLARPVRSRLLRLLGPRPDVDDALQEVLATVARRLPQFRGQSVAELEAFAHRIALRVAYRYFRQRTHADLHAVPPPADEVDPESTTMAREALWRLYRCLDRMPERRRVAFVLCAIEGLSPRDAAQLEGVTRLTMRARLHSARREVERRMSHDPYVKRLVQEARR